MTENVNVTVKQAVQVDRLIADMGVRYWEDASVNGIDEPEDDPKIPLKSGDRWIIDIELATGKIRDWPEGVTASTHYKVCDDGVYSLLSSSGQVVVKTDGYVPSMLAPNGRGYGDYVILEILPDGTIKDWNADMSYFSGDEQ